MVNVSKTEKKTAFSHQKETDNNNMIKESKQQEHINTFGAVIQKDGLQKFILTKSLIVKL